MPGLDRSAAIDGRQRYERLGERVTRLLTHAGEREEAALEARLRALAPPSRPAVIAVSSPKGGVGKTASAFLVGCALADRARLRVVAIDADHDIGTLPLLLPGAARVERGARQMLAALDDLGSASDLLLYLSIAPSGLHVLAGPFGPADRPHQSSVNLAALIELLECFYDVVLIDLGSGVSHPVIRFALRRADRVYMVTDPDRITASRVEGALWRLFGRDGSGPLAPNRVAVVVNRAVGPGRTASLIHRLRQTGVSRTVAVPDDARLGAMLDGSSFALGALTIVTRVALRELALAATPLE